MTLTYLKNIFTLGSDQKNKFHFHRTHLNSTIKQHFPSALESFEHPPGSDEVQQVLPALVDFAEFVLDLGSLAVLAGPGQALTHNLQLLLVLLSYTDLLLVVLERETHQAG